MKKCCNVVVNADIKLSFDEIINYILEEFKCVGFSDGFQHNLRFIVFKFDFTKHLSKTTIINVRVLHLRSF